MSQSSAEDEIKEEAKIGNVTKIVYRWDPPDYQYEKFIVEVYKDKELNEVFLKAETTLPEVELLNMNSDLFLRVAVVADNWSQSGFSNISTIVYDAQTLELISPEANKIYSSTSESIKVPFQWTYEGRGTCSLKFYDETGEKLLKAYDDFKIIEDISEKILGFKLKEKKYSWRVVCAKGRMEISSELRTFSLNKIPIYNSLSAFYAMSFGTFNETGVTGRKSSVTQNSLLTLGLSNEYRPPEGPHISSSLYVSSLVAKLPDSSDSKTSTEIGFTTYYNFPVNLFGFTPYSGVDIESFSTVDTDEIAINLDFEFRKQLLGYATFGVFKSVPLFNKNLLVKFSLSQTIYSSGDENPRNGKTYSGMKYILFGALGIYKDWYLTGFYKEHFLTGAGDQQVTRYGLGLSYNFF